VYLTELSSGFAAALFSLIGGEANQVADVGQRVREFERDSPAPERDIEEWERRVEVAIDSNATIPQTERTALIQARRGQGLFRDNVRSIEHPCRAQR
jgi:putative restriction endonuclease